MLPSNVIVATVLLGLVLGADGLRMPNGSYTLCASSSEQVYSNNNNLISGGVNTLRFVREPVNCADRVKTGMHRFRTFDGTCNAPGDKGSSFGVVKRYMPAYYSGPNGEPRMYGSSGRPLPNPRLVSLSVHRGKQPDDSPNTLMLMQWGQMLDHDISIVPLATMYNTSIRCCNEKNPYEDCWPITIPQNDPVYNHSCMEFLRSDPMAMPDGKVARPRQLYNAVTSFVDGSQIYGSDHERAAELRANNGTGALMKTKLYKGKERLPEGKPTACIRTQPDHFCALAGDNRVNQHPGLTSIQTLFVKEHNRLVRELVRAYLYRQGAPYAESNVQAFLNSAPAELQNRIYFTIRKVVGASWAHGVYSEWLPLILGPDMMSKYRLWSGSYIRYDPSVDPSIVVESQSSAFRLHTLIYNEIVTDKKRFLWETFGMAEHTLEYFENIVRNQVGYDTNADPFDNHIAESLSDNLFRNDRTGRPGLDLASVNIQRGRDHAIPPHNDMRQWAGLKRYTRWEEYGECGPALSKLYDDIKDVDFYTGGLCEPPVKGGVIGTTFAHVVARQFADLKYGDKYFYETDDMRYGFPPEQMKSLIKLKFSKVVCSNVGMDWIQVNAFVFPEKNSNPYYKCSDLPDINMSYWVDEVFY